MKNQFAVIALVSLLFLSSCQIVGDIFKAGMGFGIFLVVAVVGLVVFLVARVMGGGK